MSAHHPSDNSKIGYDPVLGVFKTYRGFKYQPGSWEYSFIGPNTPHGEFEFIVVSESGERGWQEFKAFVDRQFRGAA